MRSLPTEYQQKLKFNLVDPLASIKKVAEKSTLLTEEFLANVETHAD